MDISESLVAVQALLRDPLVIVTDFSATPIPPQRHRPDSRVWDVRGTARTASTKRTFHLAAKDLAPDSIELDLYESGALDHLPPGIRPPRLVAAEPTRLWLEFAPAFDPGPGGTRAVRIAGLLARAGTRLSALGPHPLVRDVRAAQEAAGTIDGWHRCRIDVTLARSRPDLVEPWYTESTLDRVDAVLARREQLIAELGPPAGLCHGDTGLHNLGEVDGDVVLYDWEEAVNGPLGVDLATFVNGSLVTGAVAHSVALEFERDAVRTYLRELDEPVKAERVYLAYATLLWGPRIHTIRSLLRGTTAQVAARYGLDVDGFLAWRSTLTAIFLRRAEAVLDLA